MYDSYQMGLIIGSLGMGAVIGLIPAIVGMKRGLAIAGFFFVYYRLVLVGAFSLGSTLCDFYISYFAFIQKQQSPKE